jgi:hypothetical protein
MHLHARMRFSTQSVPRHRVRREARAYALMGARSKCAACVRTHSLCVTPRSPRAPQVNERYLPQLAAVLAFPQSVGIVGGRPGSSLFFVGVQDRAVLYLDPHEVQEVRGWRRAARTRMSCAHHEQGRAVAAWRGAALRCVSGLERCCC